MAPSPCPREPSAEVPKPLSARTREGFPYLSLKDRLPVILAQCVDELHRKNMERTSEEERDEAKSVVQRLVNKIRIFPY